MKGEVSFQCSMFPKEEPNADNKLSMSKTHPSHCLVSSEQGKHLKEAALHRASTVELQRRSHKWRLNKDLLQEYNYLISAEARQLVEVMITKTEFHYLTKQTFSLWIPK